MRGIGLHFAPALTQPEPADNTSEHVYAQVAEWQRACLPVHPDIAREIAAWWQAPAPHYAGLTAFASSGTLLQREWEPEDEPTRVERERPVILDEIDREIGTEDMYRPEVTPLWALRHYVQLACRAAGWAY